MQYNTSFSTFSTILHSPELFPLITTLLQVPCGSDIKVGSVDYNTQDSHNKRETHKRKFLGIAPNLGFRFVGANVYNAVDKSVEKLDKDWGLSFTIENAAIKTEEYFNDKKSVRRDVLPSLIRQMTGLLEYYTSQKLFWLCRSSLLVVYDGLTPEKGTVKMIDFAHHTTQENSEDNTHVDMGLKNLIDILSHIHSERTNEWKHDK